MVSEINLELDALLRSIGSLESRRVTDVLFIATGEDFAKTYRKTRPVVIKSTTYVFSPRDAQPR